MKINAGKILKVLVPVASIAVSFATNYVTKKEQEETIAKKVSEALANSAKEGSKEA